MLKFYEKSVAYLQKKLPLDNAVLARAACLHPDIRKKNLLYARLNIWQRYLHKWLLRRKCHKSKINGGSSKLKTSIKFLKNQIKELMTTGMKCLK